MSDSSSSYSDNINDSSADEINALIAAAVSILSNSALIFATLKVTTYSNSVRQMQIFFCIIRLLFSLTVVLSSPTLAYVIECKAIFIVKGGISLPIEVGEIFLVLFLTFVVFSSTSSPVQFLQVMNIMHGIPKSKKTQIFISSLPFLIAIITAIFTTLGYVPDSSDDRLSQDVVYYLNGRGKSAYLIASFKRYDYGLDSFEPDYISCACTTFIICILISSTLTVIISYSIIDAKVRKGGMSSNSIKTQKQLNTVLLIQFILPFLTIHIPFYFSFIMPLFEIGTSTASTYLPYLFSWCPALTPILVMVVVKAIREKIWSFAKSTGQNNSGARMIPGHLRNSAIKNHP